MLSYALDNINSAVRFMNNRLMNHFQVQYTIHYIKGHSLLGQNILIKCPLYGL